MSEKNTSLDNATRVRLAALNSILSRYSDEEHMLSTNEILKYLEKEYGIKIFRTTVTRDIDALRESGLEIEIRKGSPNRYYLITRTFELPEIKLIVDAIASSKFITERKSENLISKLESFVSIYQREQIKHNIHTEIRVKSDNERSFYIVDCINEAINKKKKISFLYYEYDANKQKIMRNDGMPYKFSPYALIWNGDYYYTVGYSDKHSKVTSFRVDRIYATPDMLEEDAFPEPRDFSVSDYTKAVFGMYDEERVTVELLCENSVMKSVIDRFGEDVDTQIFDKKHFIARVDVAMSPNFFGWVFGFEKSIRIIGPTEARRRYRTMLNRGIKRLDDTKKK
ncbi:MAG: WYL domain-containing protein [Oscillospiraceae bacterium]|nr:WYL domain-containing protein [Oscillospiraceae bacterium]